MVISVLVSRNGIFQVTGEKTIGLSEMFLLKLVRIPGYAAELSSWDSKGSRERFLLEFTDSKKLEGRKGQT